MAISIDTSWARATNTSANSVTTGSHTPAAGTLLLALCNGNSDFGENPTPSISSSPSLTWTTIGIENGGGPINGITAAYWAIADGSSTTVTFSTTSVLNHVSIHVVKVTGQHATPLGASVTGSSTTNNLTTTAYTSTANNSRGFAVGTEWTAPGGSPTTTDTSISAFDTGSLDGIAVHKATDTATAGSSVTFNLDAPGAAAAEWTYVAFEVVPAAAGAAPPPIEMAPNMGIFRRGWRAVPSGMKSGTQT